jgi:hypothetical protein
MTTTNPRDANLRRAIPSAWPGAGQETYEQLLAFADTVGAACAEASQRINAAYAGACEKLAHNPSGWQDGLTKAQQTLLGAVTDPSFLTTRGEDVQDRVLALSDTLAEMGIDVALAYLRALEEATISVAKCQEQLGAASQLDLVKATTTIAAELLRKVAQAGASTVREVVG